jgi:hypothetical protein
MSERVIRIFISHSWDHDDDYLALIRIIRKANLFKFYNYSVPEEDPLRADNDKELMQEICDQLRGCHILLVIANMCPTYSEWIQKEVLIARVYGKPVLGVIPWGQRRISSFVIEYSDGLVRWNSKSIARAILRLIEEDKK